MAGRSRKHVTYEVHSFETSSRPDTQLIKAYNLQSSDLGNCDCFESAVSRLARAARFHPMVGNPGSVIRPHKSCTEPVLTGVRCFAKIGQVKLQIFIYIYICTY